MAGFLAPLAVGLGGAVVSSLFGGRKEYHVPSYAEFYAQYRKQFPEEFGLSDKEFAQSYGGGADFIRSERDVAIARAKRGLPRDSVAQGLVPIQAASQSQQAFAELVGRVQSLHARTAKEEQAQYQSQALGAYGAELQALQLQMGQESQSEQFLNNFIQQVSDPIQGFQLMKEMENLDRANQAKYVPWWGTGQPGAQQAGQTQFQHMYPAGRMPYLTGLQ